MQARLIAGLLFLGLAVTPAHGQDRTLGQEIDEKYGLKT
jgi:hypothetical protein